MGARNQQNWPVWRLLSRASVRTKAGVIPKPPCCDPVYSSSSSPPHCQRKKGKRKLGLKLLLSLFQIFAQGSRRPTARLSSKHLQTAALAPTKRETSSTRSRTVNKVTSGQQGHQQRFFWYEVDWRGAVTRSSCRNWFYFDEIDFKIWPEKAPLTKWILLLPTADETDFTSAADFACDTLTKLNALFLLHNETDFTYDEIGREKGYKSECEGGTIAYSLLELFLTSNSINTQDLK